MELRTKELESQVAILKLENQKFRIKVGDLERFIDKKGL